MIMLAKHCILAKISSIVKQEWTWIKCLMNKIHKLITWINSHIMANHFILGLNQQHTVVFDFNGETTVFFWKTKTNKFSIWIKHMNLMWPSSDWWFLTLLLLKAHECYSTQLSCIHMNRTNLCTNPTFQSFFCCSETNTEKLWTIICSFTHTHDF